MGWYTDSEEEEDVSDLADLDPDTEPRSWLKWIALGLAAWIGISLMVLGGMLRYRGDSTARLASGDSPSAITDLPTASATGAASTDSTLFEPTTSAPGGTPAPTPTYGPGVFAPPGADNLPIGWTVVASDEQSDCSEHSFGTVRTYFSQTPCVDLHRWLATTTFNGRKAIVSWVIVRMADAATAEQFLALVSRDGTGNVKDLLTDGKRFEDLPKKMPPSAFSSNYYGDTVHIAQAAWATATSSDTDPDLQKLADQGLVLN